MVAILEPEKLWRVTFWSPSSNGAAAGMNTANDTFTESVSNFKWFEDVIPTDSTTTTFSSMDTSSFVTSWLF